MRSVTKMTLMASLVTPFVLALAGPGCSSSSSPADAGSGTDTGTGSGKDSSGGSGKDSSGGSGKDSSMLMDAAGLLPAACETCMNSMCQPSWNNCLEDSACIGILKCLDACVAGADME